MSHREWKALVSLSVLIFAFATFMLLFVPSPPPPGAPISFAPPSGTFTGTTTITTSFGYVCMASTASRATEYLANGTIRTLIGIGVSCHPGLFGSLQVLAGPVIFVIWLISFAATLGLVAFYFRTRLGQRQPESPKDITRNEAL